MKDRALTSSIRRPTVVPGTTVEHDSAREAGTWGERAPRLTRSVVAVRAATIALLLIGGDGLAEEITARNRMEVVEAVGRLKPGDHIRIAPGSYAGGIHVQGLQGTAERPIRISALDPDEPPVFEGGANGFHFSACRGLHLSALTVTGCSANGINIDDGGERDRPAERIRLERMVILSTGPTGNRDALKMSGVRNFEVVDCRFEGWGGSAIDMVGCHEGVVRGCTFRGLEGFSQDNGVQAKGGSSRIRVLSSFFANAGQRAINAGGSTGVDFLRPADAPTEASEIEVAGCRFTGGDCAVAFVTSRDCRFHHNTIDRPGRWVLRILQESGGDRFPPSGGHRFDHNLVVFDASVRAPVNIGPGTEPESFAFDHNVWHRIGSDSGRPIPLPGKVEENAFGIDPQLIDAGQSTMRPGATDAVLATVGAHAWRE